MKMRLGKEVPHYKTMQEAINSVHVDEIIIIHNSKN
jgi:hypothetical protein